MVEMLRWNDPPARRNAAALVKLTNGHRIAAAAELVDGMDAHECAELALALSVLANSLLLAWADSSGIIRRKAGDRGVLPSEVAQQWLEDTVYLAAAEERP